MTSEFDADTALERVGSGRYAAELSDRWNIGPVPNGGYILALALGAAERELDAPDLISVSGYYLGRAQPGPAEVRAEVVKRGRSFSTTQLSLVQNGREVLRALATHGDLVHMSGPTHIAGEPPDVPPANAPEVNDVANAPAIAARFDQRPVMSTLSFFNGEPSGEAEVRSRIRFADRRLPDTRSLALFADALPPPIFNVMAPGWVPTLELTVHVRARPRSEWLRAVFRSRFAFGGLLEEDGELWDDTGTLVAQSRQLAGAPRGF